MKTRIGILIVAAGAFLPLFACLGVGEEEASPDPKLTGKLKTFSSDEELVGYLQSLPSDGPVMAYDAEASDGDTANGSNAEITNNQVSGVDEGGLVKNLDDLLIVLRQGRLISTRVGNDGTLERRDEVEVTPDGYGDAVWYDELLIEGHLALVIGYRSDAIAETRGATELNLFEVGVDGEIARKGTYFIESNDYYSWRNYAGRVVEGKLVLYMPFAASSLLDEDEELRLPRIFRYDGRELREEASLFQSTDIYRPVRESAWPTFHSVVSCDLEEEFACDARVIVAPWFRELFVSRTDAYLWVDASAENRRNHLYRIPLDLSTPGFLEVPGTPLDQFSFAETENGLEVVVTVEEDDEVVCGDAGGEGPFTRAWFRIANEHFTVNGGRADELINLRYDFSDHPTCIQFRDNLWLDHNRFSSTHLVYSGNDEETGETVLVTVSGGTAEITSLPIVVDNVSRLELAGDRMAVVGEREDRQCSDWECWGSDFVIGTFILLELGENPRLGSTLEFANLVDGEWRSHGFRYHADDRFESFGLAVTNGLGQRGVYFFQIGSAGDLNPAGAFGEVEFSEPTEECTVSCVDWYGSSRPIYLGGQVLALIGDQFSIGRLDDEGTLEASEHINLLTGEVVR